MLQGVRTHKTELFIDTAVKPQIQYELHCIYHIVLCFICHVHRDIVHMLRHVSLWSLSCVECSELLFMVISV
jgi:hypothetical protein